MRRASKSILDKEKIWRVYIGHGSKKWIKQLKWRHIDTRIDFISPLIERSASIARFSYYLAKTGTVMLQFPTGEILSICPPKDKDNAVQLYVHAYSMAALKRNLERGLEYLKHGKDDVAEKCRGVLEELLVLIEMDALEIMHSPTLGIYGV